jgi:serine/threonine-protein kinase
VGDAAACAAAPDAGNHAPGGESPTTDHLGLGFTPALAVSPDGTRLVYVANRGGTRQLYVRLLDRFEATPIHGTEGAETPFFSPDGQSVGFFADGKLKKVPLSGGAPLTLCSASVNRGASWGPDDTIIFTPYNVFSGLFRVSASGGTPKPLTVPDRKKGEFSHRWPQILPGGKAVLITIWTGNTSDSARIDVLSLVTGERQTLIEGGSYGRYFPSGHLVYARAGGLLAVPFDLKRLRVTGPPVPILEEVTMSPITGAAEFGASADSSFAYVPGAETGVGTLLWVDRQGAPRPLPAPPRVYMWPRLSPDGQRAAVGIVGGIAGIWLYDLARGTLTRLIELRGTLASPTWTPDGKRLTFSSLAGGVTNLYWMAADGSGASERLTTGENFQWPVPGLPTAKC